MWPTKIKSRTNAQPKQIHCKEQADSNKKHLAQMDSPQVSRKSLETHQNQSFPKESMN